MSVKSNTTNEAREKLIQILNKARCLDRRSPGNGELADRIIDVFDLTERERMVCGCHVGAHEEPKS